MVLYCPYVSLMLSMRFPFLPPNTHTHTHTHTHTCTRARTHTHAAHTDPKVHQKRRSFEVFAPKKCRHVPRMYAPFGCSTPLFPPPFSFYDGELPLPDVLLRTKMVTECDGQILTFNVVCQTIPLSISPFPPLVFYIVGRLVGQGHAARRRKEGNGGRQRGAWQWCGAALDGVDE